MEMVKHVHRIRAILIYRGDEGGGEICCNILDVNAFSSDPFPKAIQGVCSFAVTDIENTATLQVNHDCLVHMSFPDRKFIYANAVHSFKGGRRVMVFKMTRMDILDGIPGYAQEIGCVFQGHAP